LFILLVGKQQHWKNASYGSALNQVISTLEHNNHSTQYHKFLSTKNHVNLPVTPNLLESSFLRHQRTKNLNFLRSDHYSITHDSPLMNVLPFTVLLLLVGCWDTEDAERPLGGSGGVGLVAANPKGVSEPKLVCCEEGILERPAESRSSFWSSKTIRNRRAVMSYVTGRKFLYGNQTLHIAYIKTHHLNLSQSIYFTTSLFSV
jgi:hypothetical protein